MKIVKKYNRYFVVADNDFHPSIINYEREIDRHD